MNLIQLFRLLPPKYSKVPLYRFQPSCSIPKCSKRFLFFRERLLSSISCHTIFLVLTKRHILIESIQNAQHSARIWKVGNALERSWGFFVSLYLHFKHNSGTWRSLVAHLNGVQGVASSNPAVPTRSQAPRALLGAFFQAATHPTTEKLIRTHFLV